MERDNNNINLININTITNKGPIVARGWIKILNGEHNFKIVYINKKTDEYWK